MALKLRLKPGEKCLVNGAVISNGKSDRAIEILVHNRAIILREPDIMQAEEATTPARRAYFAFLALLMAPHGSEAEVKHVHGLLLAAVSAANGDQQVVDTATQISIAMATGDYYRALKHFKALVATESPNEHGSVPKSRGDRLDRPAA